MKTGKKGGWLLWMNLPACPLFPLNAKASGAGYSLFAAPAGDLAFTALENEDGLASGAAHKLVRIIVIVVFVIAGPIDFFRLLNLFFGELGFY